MPFHYEANPQRIEQQSFEQIRALCELDEFDLDAQQVVMRVVHSLGIPELVQHIRISDQACAKGREALARSQTILCDVEMVKQGVTKRMIQHEPKCFLNDESTVQRANSTGETRSMAALEFWRPQLKDSIVLIGNAPTALFRLLEMLEQGADKPALIVGMPVGFVGAAESKQALWENHMRLGVECITLAGRFGGSAVTSAACNALLRCNVGEYY